jgi:hypothetical protein
MKICLKEKAAMHRQTISLLMIVCAPLSLVGLTAVAQAQQADSANSQYQGVSRPPQSPIETSPEPAPVIAKPSAAVLATPAPSVQTTAPATYAAQPVQDDSQPIGTPAPALTARSASIAPVSENLASSDPDGDIVHPPPARPGELLEGATIRVRLTDRLSSTESEKGEPFRGQVASDVLQDGKVLIPAGSGIEGRVTAVSAGHFGGHGSLRLRPEAVILPDGSRYQLHAETTGTPGSRTRIGAEGSINPGSRVKTDGVEYGAVVGTGAVVGAVVGGPVGALTGGLIGAGVVTTHILVDHPQATLEPGSILLFSLTEPMNLTPVAN